MSRCNFLLLFFVLCSFIIPEVVRASCGKVEEAEEEEEVGQQDDVQIWTDLIFAKENKAAKDSLVMFHAPWCGHCQRLSPEFSVAGTVLKFEDPAPITLAKVDCTGEGKKTCEEFKVRGFPTLMIFSRGELVKEYNGGRTTKELIKYMRKELKNRKPEVEEEAVEEEEEVNGPVQHWVDENFDQEVSKVKDVLVFFHVPWCGHCKALTPEFGKAAEALKSKPVVLAMVDCTCGGKDSCVKYEARKVPTFVHFQNGEAMNKYEGERTSQKIVEFMENVVKGNVKTGGSKGDEL